MAFSINITVTRKNWMSDPKLRWNAGLDRAGNAWRTSNARSTYPPIPPSGDRRTNQFADQSDYEITEPGVSMNFGSTFYAPFILFGTRKWAGWPGHLDSSVDMMKDGFINGVREYQE